MSKYIALRGKLEWVPGTKDATTSSPEGAATSKSETNGQQEGSYWQWTGVWAFGDRIVPKDEVGSPPPGESGASSGDVATSATPKKKAVKAQLQQPFRYTWDSKVFPKDVLVPSVVQPTITPPSTGESEGGSAEKKVDDSSSKGEGGAAQDSSSKEEGGVATSETITKETETAPKKTETSETAPKVDSTGQKPTMLTQEAKKMEVEPSKPDNSDETKAVETAEIDSSRDKESPVEFKNQPQTTDDKNQNLTKTKPMAVEASDKAPPKSQEEEKEQSTDIKESQPETPELITFATVDPGDPPFTDAFEKYGVAATTGDASATPVATRGGKCPTSGKWVGYFQNATGRNRDRIHRVQEQFYMFLNATPGPNARSEYDDEDDTNEDAKGAEDPAKASPGLQSDNLSTKIPDGHIHVRGMGENQFGTFELVGVLDLESMILGIQRKYVYVEPSPSPRRRSSSSAASSLTPNSAVVTRHQSNRPSRKRQPTWKRKSFYGDDEDDQSTKRKRRPKSSPPGTAPTTASSVGPAGGTLQGGNPLAPRALPPGSNFGQPVVGGAGSLTSVASPLYPGLQPNVTILTAPAVSGTVIPGVTPLATGSFVPPHASSQGAPGQGFAPSVLKTTTASCVALPSTGGSSRKRSSSVSKSGSAKQVKRQSNSATKATITAAAAAAAAVKGTNTAVTTTTATYVSSSLTGSPYLKLPPVGDPKKARWRAAHFLYYQRHDPTDETQQGSITSTSGVTNNVNNNAIRVVPYTSSTAAAAAAASTSLYGGVGLHSQGNNTGSGGNSKSLNVSSGTNNSQNASTTSTTSHSSLPTNPRYVVYEGEMLDGKRDGRGISLYSNGMLYEGTWKRDKEHGKGKLMTADRQRIIYDGEFEKGRMQGMGIYYYAQAENSLSSPSSLATSALTTKATAGTSGSSSSLSKSGGVKRRRKSGGKSVGGDSIGVDGAATNGTEGAKIEDAGSRYHGDFKENMRNGYGTYIFPDGSIYVGLWRDGLMNGRGAFTWPDNSYYDGEWKDGKRHGAGILKASDGFFYEGQWDHNSMDGRGSAIYPGGQRYDGMFVNGRRDGRGTIYFTNGAVYEGRFRDDEIDGQGTMKMSRTMVVPRSRRKSSASTNFDETGSSKSGTVSKFHNAGKKEGKGVNIVDRKEEKEDEDDEMKEDFMIPISFQSDMTHIHAKAGFTAVGH